MNKQAKIIIAVLSVVIVVLLFMLISTGNINFISNNKAVGVYHNNNWNNHEATLVLNKDMTCKYPTGATACKWTISDNTIKIILSSEYGDSEHIATLTNNGIVLHDHLFIKLN